MDVTQIPFNEFIGLNYSDNPDYLLMMNDKQEYKNHLGTVHASVQFALAEATSGYFLSKEFSGLTNIIAVVRNVELKYRKPATGKIFSNAEFIKTEKKEVLNSLYESRRALLKVEVSLFDAEHVLVLQSVFEWFVSVNK